MKECPTCKRELKDQLSFCPFDGHMLVAKPERDPLIGLVLDDKYRIEEKVGEGGMGTVYKATHIHMDSTVAIKILHPHLAADKVALERFKREARALAHVRHVNAVAVTDFGVTRDTGTAYLVMEFLEGVELRERLKGKQLDYEETLNIVRQTCSAVHAAHSKGIIHRDLKPDNIWLFRDEDGTERVKVLDFGIAKLRDFAEAGTLTQQGMIVGTPFYMSPEQCRGETLDARSDIYTLGVITYEMLTGSVPFKAATPMAVVVKHMNEPPRPLRELRPDIPREVQEVVLRALDKDRNRRQESAAALARELEAAMIAAGIEFKNLVRTPSESRATPQDTIGGQARRTTGEQITTVSDYREPPETLKLPEPNRVPTLFKGFASRKRGWLFPALATVAVIAVAAPVLMLARKAGKRDDPAPTGTKAAANTTGPITAPPGMVYIPGGKFVMGNNLSTDPAEKPEHEVTVAPFFIDKYEVTNKEYKKFLDDRPGYLSPDGWVGGDYPVGQGDYPVTGVTWGEARDYAQWAHRMLPTEVQWEYAARGTDKRLYPWGNERIRGNANTRDSGKDGPSPVDQFSKDKSPFGVFDLEGNVAEWVGAIYEPYEGSKAKQQPNRFVVRGGSYALSLVGCEVTTRFIAKQEDKRPYLGFRCAKAAP